MNAKYNVPLLNVLCKLPLHNCSVLSLGCGSALLEHELEKLFSCKVTGFDVSETVIREAKKIIHDARTIDLEKENIALLFKSKFDYIICADILEHLRDPAYILTECSKLLKANGNIIISLPNIANWSIRLQLLLGEFNYTAHGILDKTHLHFYTCKTAKELVSNHFMINKMHYSSSLINILRKKFKHTISLQKKEIENKPTYKEQKRRYFKKMCEQTDNLLTYLFPNLFAYQFIIIAMKSKEIKG